MNGPAFWNKLLADISTTYRTQGIVAGGAVRDWMLGIEPNDIDIFLASASTLFNNDTPDGWEYIRTVSVEEYPNAPERFNVKEFRVDNTIVQVVFLELGFFTHYTSFDNNLTKGYYTPKDIFSSGRLILSDELLYGLEYQRIYPLVGMSENVVNRMNEQRDRLNQTMPGWIVQDNNPLQAVPAPRAARPGLALGDFADALQERPQPVPMRIDAFGDRVP
jgi:hypothetical protein